MRGSAGWLIHSIPCPTSASVTACSTAWAIAGRASRSLPISARRSDSKWRIFPRDVPRLTICRSHRGSIIVALRGSWLLRCGPIAPSMGSASRLTAERFVAEVMSGQQRHWNKYGSYAELASFEVHGRDYRVRAIERPDSPVLIIAPHGGMIEVGTSEIASGVAAAEYNLFSFEGLKPDGANRDLHITSHRFDHPECVAMASRCDIVVTVHGCQGEARIHVGGLDTGLGAHLAARLAGAGFAVETEGHRYPGR